MNKNYVTKRQQTKFLEQLRSRAIPMAEARELAEEQEKLSFKG